METSSTRSTSTGGRPASRSSRHRCRRSVQARAARALADRAHSGVEVSVRGSRSTASEMLRADGCPVDEQRDVPVRRGRGQHVRMHRRRDGEGEAKEDALLDRRDGVRIQPEPVKVVRGACRSGHSSSCCRPTITSSEYQPKHTSKAVCEMFWGFGGYIQADAHCIYDASGRGEGATPARLRRRKLAVSARAPAGLGGRHRRKADPRRERRSSDATSSFELERSGSSSAATASRAPTARASVSTTLRVGEDWIRRAGAGP